MHALAVMILPQPKAGKSCVFHDGHSPWKRRTQPFQIDVRSIPGRLRRNVSDCVYSAVLPCLRKVSVKFTHLILSNIHFNTHNFFLFFTATDCPQSIHIKVRSVPPTTKLLDDMYSRLSRTTYPAPLTIRDASPSSASGGTHSLCVELHGGNIVMSKTTLIAAFTICVLITCISMLAVAALLYREWARRREAKAAKQWGRKSRVDQRISCIRKEIDNQYSAQYSGCLHQEPENPEMGSESPVEMMFPERLCEAPAIAARTTNKNKRKSQALSLFFDQGIGVWMPKRSRNEEASNSHPDDTLANRA